MLSKFSVKKPYTVFVAVVLILILGTISFMNLQTDLLPSLELPYIVVVTPYPGASPEEVETIVTRPLEQILATTSNIKNVSSVSRESSSMVIMEFNNTVNMDSAMIEVNGNLDIIKPNWSDGVGTPTVIKMNPDMLPIMIAAVDSKDMDISQVSLFARDTIIPELESVEGVASVEGTGMVEETIEVTLLPGKLEEINKKILNNIDSELSKAEDELLKAKAEIEKGIRQLDAEFKKQADQLVQGKSALNDAKLEIEAGEEALRSAENQLLSQISQTNIALEALAIAERELNTQISELESLEEDLDDDQLASLALLKSGLEETLTRKASMESIIAELNGGLGEIRSQKEALRSGKQELLTNESALDQGQITLNIEISRARDQLMESLAQVESGLIEMEESKDRAFREANLEGVITPDMITGILAAQNFSMPAGYLQGEVLVKVGDRISDTEEMENLLLFDTQNDEVGKIYLKDVAQVADTDNSSEIYAKVNGQDAVILTFQKQSNYSTAEVASSIRDRIETVEANHEGLTITPLMDQGVYIDIVIDSVLRNLAYGGILAILILLIFLRDLRPTIIIALSIPISLVFAITMMYFTGVTINIISLGGLALGVGMLVDNSVVVIENIYRLKSSGMTSFKASIEGAKQVTGALTASTLTTTAVFLPVVFTQGISRQIFTDMGLTIAYSLIASLIIALTLVPVISSGIFKKLDSKNHMIFDKMVDKYEMLLRMALKWKIAVIAFVVVMLGASGFGAAYMGTSFIPEMDGAEMSVSINMDRDSTFEERAQISDEVVGRIMDIEGIETIGAFAGGGGGMMGFGGSGGGNVSLYILLDENKSVSNQRIAREIQDATEDLDAEIIVETSNMNLGAIAGSGVEVVIKGNDIDVLRDISTDVADILRDTQGMIEVVTGFEDNGVELRVTVDKEKAMENGLTVAQVFAAVSQGISQGQRATILNIQNQEYPVMVIDGKTESVTQDNLHSFELNVQRNEISETVKLGEIAEISEAQGLSAIRRDSQERYVSVTGSVDADHNIGLVSREFSDKLSDYEVPEGYKIQIAGETETINETLGDLIKMILLAIVFVYLIMVAQFQSLLSPFIVMFTIPLAFTGGLLALFITGNEISVISMLGFLVLSGVVVNNGIVFVDYTNQLMLRGFDKKSALIEAGRVRIRPILMTAITTILGLSTLSVGMGMGAEMLQPLAITAIGGLTYATLLTLFVVPVMYDLFHPKSKIKSGEETAQ
ncbi:efflux RND transporter permease subunit [Alkalibacter saccharofermentans]|uniref:Hydrophobic/amphiphilic exporter-1, HAE1 family n=1 Tax=Alkalibacter saccharofermentans DSM 14828 TaxID=1120975 RepID=A0A1M4VEV1_9FIRM|nr:efflux RND transporter permease subunit [Alkalibacter saccharofermentans]SHE67477.1 hydrophobic/amphiphilic exporter-1, HAE1 family [Alkalibacter saccharofermentans DSM 14828]